MDRANAVEPAASLNRTKVEIRRAIEAEGIPYTYLVSNGFAGYLNYILNNFGDSGSASPPTANRRRRALCSSPDFATQNGGRAG